MWIIIIIVVLIVIFNINKNYKESVKTNVTNYRGMLVKYSKLVDYFTNESMSIQKVTNTSIRLASRHIEIYIDCINGDTEIRLRGLTPITKDVNKKWVFPNGYPQEKMQLDLENYFEWQLTKAEEAMSNNPYKHL